MFLPPLPPPPPAPPSPPPPMTPPPSNPGVNGGGFGLTTSEFAGMPVAALIGAVAGVGLLGAALTVICCRYSRRNRMHRSRMQKYDAFSPASRRIPDDDAPAGKRAPATFEHNVTAASAQACQDSGRFSYRNRNMSGTGLLDQSGRSASSSASRTPSSARFGAVTTRPMWRSHAALEDFNVSTETAPPKPFASKSADRCSYASCI